MDKYALSELSVWDAEQLQAHKFPPRSGHFAFDVAQIAQTEEVSLKSGLLAIHDTKAYLGRIRSPFAYCWRWIEQLHQIFIGKIKLALRAHFSTPILLEIFENGQNDVLKAEGGGIQVLEVDVAINVGEDPVKRAVVAMKQKNI